jgi:hypothetical protein
LRPRRCGESRAHRAQAEQHQCGGHCRNEGDDALAGVRATDDDEHGADDHDRDCDRYGSAARHLRPGWRRALRNLREESRFGVVVAAHDSCSL